jgi:hypothetical protein
MYQAGVLRALQEAGVRIDVVAGHGIGAVTAAFAAIDGGAALWDDTGLWLGGEVRGFYRWRRPFRVAAALAAILLIVLAVPLVVLAIGALAYAVGYLLTLVGLGLGDAVVSGVSAQLATAFASAGLPTIVPRLAVLVVLAMVLALLASALERPPQGMRRTMRGWWWWRLLSAPLDLVPLRSAVARRLGSLLPDRGERPTPVTLSRRYGEVLGENVGQPGFRELLVAITDLDAHRDIVGALLAPPLRRRFFGPQPGRARQQEVVDFTSSGRDMVDDMLGAALAPPIGVAAQALRFPPDSYWSGETHRGCDRPGMLGRLLQELDLAQVTQVILVSATAPGAAASRLRTPPFDPRARLGEYCAAAECTALDEAVRAARSQFDAVFTIRPVHNPLGPFDMAGIDDESTDRRKALVELRDQGYHDAHLQFIEPVVGASGEQLAPALT